MMANWSRQSSFLQTLGIKPGDRVCLVGAGGKTSLLFHLAKEAKNRGLRVLVTTTTRMLIPRVDQYDHITLTGSLYSPEEITSPGIYIGGQPALEPKKMVGADSEILQSQRDLFDLILMEADGAAKKSLKGWKTDEPVIPDFTSITIGVIDIQTLGKDISPSLVHRLDLFCSLTKGKPGEKVGLDHLQALISHKNGLFQYASPRKIVYINKIESKVDFCQSQELRKRLPTLNCAAGSVQRGEIYV